MNEVIEIRTIGVSPVRIEGRTLHGVAIPYNSDSHDLGGFTERFLPGSLTETIKSGLIEACLYHDRSLPIGSQGGGTLRLLDTPQGLNYECKLPDTSYARDFMAMQADGRRDVAGTSIGFKTMPQGDQWKRDGNRNLREVTKAHLDHISPVITPAYPATTASLRAFGLSGADADEAYGIDLRKLAQIFIAANKGLEVSIEERELARKAIIQLDSVFKAPRLNEATKRAMNVLL